jgi:hypothetical protein
MRFHILRIDGKSRLSLTDPQGAGDLKERPKSSFQILFKDKLKREKVRDIVFDAFKKYFVIDPTNTANLSIRLSSVEPASVEEEQGLHDRALAFHSNAEPISGASDGVKAFIGIISAVVAGDPGVILIDEPEAFLHPPLAAKLGKEICHSLRGSLKNLFASTHSPNFVMGCIQSGVAINIVRLAYLNGIATARLLPSSKILKMMRDPLLRSVGLLDALFYEFVIVTEADSDRAFYQEINERLLTYGEGRGISNCLFLNAQNKQTIHQIIGPLRELGIPCAGIVDVDVVKEGGTNWTSLMASAIIPSVTINSTQTSRSHIKQKFDEAGRDFKKYGGVAVLGIEDQESCNNLFDELDRYGIFTVRRGEVESWLKELGVNGHGPGWLIPMFQKLGEDPESSSYVKPGVGDVWAFIDGVKNWFVDVKRKGMPD